MTRLRAIRHRLEDVYPPMTLPLADRLTRVYSSRYRHQLAFERRMRPHFGRPPTVQNGPFRGMRYLTVSSGSSLLPKLAGTYEREVATVVERAIAAQPDYVIDIGSAEGYYAVGLALRLPGVRVEAFDSRRSARHLTRTLARLNGVEERIAIQGWCTYDQLRGGLWKPKRPLIVCDIDGGEADTLCQPMPEMAKASILVETHDCFVPGITDQLVAHFASTHIIERYDAQARTGAEVHMRGISPDDARAVADERRPVGQAWLWMVPKH